ncbi:MFS transporter [Streptomyces roseoviridis]|uniref:MFS transporter n=1 Tax=Streptomyces roseoviridis TaxID=67361 RepID=A0ABV5QVU3_9ACTN
MLPALCAPQITGWGVVSYAFPVLNPGIARATGWSTSMTSAAFSLAVITSGIAGILVGKAIDHRGPRTVMTAGSVAGVVSPVVVAGAPNPPVFFTGWPLAGLAMAATFHQPAFAALTRSFAPDHVRALTVVTLDGGPASTAFAAGTSTSHAERAR